MIDISKLFRPPLKNGNLTWVGQETIREVVSPDKKFEIAFSHFQEVAMGAYEGLFSLLDDDENIIDSFEPLVAISSSDCCWTDDSLCFSLAIRFNRTYGYLIVHIPSFTFSFIRIFNPYPLNISFKGNVFIVAYDDSQVASANSKALFGGGTDQLPNKRYSKPSDFTFNINDLEIYSRDQLKNIAILTANYKEYRLELNDEGYNEFHGSLPQDTIKGYNGRAFEMYQLEAFADYGDNVSRIWLEEIKRKTNNKYNFSGKVFDYIGFRRREDDEK